MNRILAISGLDRAAVRQGLLLALAALIAFAIAAALHVHHAYWAAMPVFVVAQPMRGLVFERGLFRLLGTLAGAGIGLWLLQLSPHPVAMLALLGLWVGINAGLTHALSGVHGYAALLAGMTAAVVMLPSVFDPGNGMPLALARAECTLIGVVVAMVVIGLATPHGPRDAFRDEVGQAADAAKAEIAALLRGEGGAAGERALLLRLAELQERGPLVFAGSLSGYRSLHHLQALVVAALGAMVAARGLRRRDPPAALAAAGRLDTAPLADHDRSAAAADPMLARDLPAMDAARRALAQAAEPDSTLSWKGLRLRLSASFDPAIAAWVGLLAGSATFVAGVVAYRLGWPEAELTALGVCIFAMVLGSLPRPRSVAPIMLRGVIAGVVVAVGYRLAVQPWVEGLPVLLLTLAPFLVLGGLARASRRFGAPALDANMCFLLAAQVGAPAAAQASAVFAGAAALVVAVALVTTTVRLLPDPNRYRRRNAERAIRHDLARIAGGKQGGDGPAFGRRTDRQLMRLALHLGQASTGEGRRDGSLVALLDAGTLLAGLRARAAETGIAAGDRTQIARVLAAAAQAPAGLEAAERAALESAAHIRDPRLAAETRDLAAALGEGRRALETA